MSKLDDVRALFVPGESVVCLENTYKRVTGDPRGDIGRVWKVGKVGRSVWSPVDDPGWRGTFPTRVGDVLHVDGTSATWRIERVNADTGERHTVTYAKAAS